MMDYKQTYLVLMDFIEEKARAEKLNLPNAVDLLDIEIINLEKSICDLNFNEYVEFIRALIENDVYGCIEDNFDDVNIVPDYLTFTFDRFEDVEIVRTEMFMFVVENGKIVLTKIAE